MDYHVPKLTGRDKELDQMKEFLEAAVDGTGNVVLVCGEAGIGKTRLVQELKAIAEPLAVKVLEGRCLYESPTPFLPFRDALRSVFHVTKSDTLPQQRMKIKKAIKESAPHFVQAIPIVGQIIAGATVAYSTYKDEKSKEKQVALGTLFERDEGLETISSLLTALSERQPLLLFIDDLHLADTPSLSLLYYLARKILESKILVVATYRPEEITKTYQGTPHPLLEILQRMSRDNLFQRIELKRLSETDYSGLISSMLGVDLADLAKLIYKETEGNPLFAIETIRLLVQQNGLIKEDGDWTLAKSIEAVDIPPRVYGVVVRRITALTDDERNILDCASVVGEEFSSGVVESVSGLNRIPLLRSLNLIERKHHLIHSCEDRFRFDHSKIREVLYQEIAPELRKAYHTMTAEYLEEKNKDHLDEVVNELAYHYYRAGNAQKGIPNLLKAGADAGEKWALYEAMRFYSQALEMMNNDERWRNERTKTLEALGGVYALTAQHEKANDCYEKGMTSTRDDATRERMRRKIRRKNLLDKNGVKLAYYVYGGGKPTLVFVIAWIWTAEHWLPQVNYFSRNFKMVTVDMRGAGESDKPADNYTLDLYVDDLNSIIEELPEEKVVLIGECIGASIALKYATKHPEKVAKLVLVNGSPKFLAADGFPHGTSENDWNTMLALFEESYRKWLRAFLELIFPEPGTEYLKEWGFQLSQKTTQEITMNSLMNLFDADLRPLLEKINVPTLILHGEDDGAVRWTNAEYMHEKIPGSIMHVFRESGHFPSITAADKFNRILEAFVTTGKLVKD